MRKLLAAPAVIGAVALLAGCHSGTTPKVSASASSVASADAAKEQKVIDTCLAKGTILTKTGRQAFYSCASGGMSAAAFEACATRQLTSASLLTKSGRSAWELSVAQKCVVAS